MKFCLGLSGNLEEHFIFSCRLFLFLIFPTNLEYSQFTSLNQVKPCYNRNSYIQIIEWYSCLGIFALHQQTVEINTQLLNICFRDTLINVTLTFLLMLIGFKYFIAILMLILQFIKGIEFLRILFIFYFLRYVHGNDQLFNMTVVSYSYFYSNILVSHHCIYDNLYLF